MVESFIGSEQVQNLQHESQTRFALRPYEVANSSKSDAPKRLERKYHKCRSSHPFCFKLYFPPLHPPAYPHPTILPTLKGACGYPEKTKRVAHFVQGNLNSTIMPHQMPNARRLGERDTGRYSGRVHAGRSSRYHFLWSGNTRWLERQVLKRYVSVSHYAPLFDDEHFNGFGLPLPFHARKTERRLSVLTTRRRQL